MSPSANNNNKGNAKNGEVEPAPVIEFPLAHLGLDGKKKSKKTGTTHNTKTDIIAVSSTNPNAQPKTSFVSTIQAMAPVMEQSPEQQAAELKQWFDAKCVPEEENGNVLEKPYNDRIALLQGPTAKIVCGNDSFDFPVRLMLAMSPTARATYTSTQELGPYNVDPLLVGGVKRIVDWFKFSLPRRDPFRLRSAGSLEIDHDVILAAEALDMKLYVERLRSYWWGWLKSAPVEEIGFPILEALEKRFTDKFESTIILMVVKVQAYRYFHEEIGQPEQLLEWLKKLPKLQAAFFGHVDRIQQMRQNRLERAERKQKEKADIEFAREQLKHQRRMAMKEKRAENKQMREQFAKTMGGSGVKTISHKDLKFLPGAPKGMGI